MTIDAIQIIPVGPMENCAYLVTSGHKALLIDPAWDIDALEQALAGKELAGVLFTHGHFDHVKFSKPLLEKYALKAYLEEHDVSLSGLPSTCLQTYQGDQQLQIGPFDVRLLATPGHTAGSVCILMGDALFTGDTLFAGACGRVDLPSSNPRAMRQSLRRIAALPEKTRIFTGHSYNGTCQTTVGYEKQYNPFVRQALRGDF